MTNPTSRKKSVIDYKHVPGEIIRITSETKPIDIVEFYKNKLRPITKTKRKKSKDLSLPEGGRG